MPLRDFEHQERKGPPDAGRHETRRQTHDRENARRQTEEITEREHQVAQPRQGVSFSSFNPKAFSISSSSRRSCESASVSAWPVASLRPVRPTRWT